MSQLHLVSQSIILIRHDTTKNKTIVDIIQSTTAVDRPHHLRPKFFEYYLGLPGILNDPVRCRRYCRLNDPCCNECDSVDAVTVTIEWPITLQLAATFSRKKNRFPFKHRVSI